MSVVRQFGFSLIETLLVIVLVGLLAALLLPLLGRTLASSRDLVSMSNMRSHAQALSAYAASNDDHIVAATYPNATWSVLRGCGTVHQVPYFHIAYLWHIPLCSDYLGGDLAHATLSHPSAQDPPGGTSYLLTASFLAVPAYWNAQTRVEGRSQWGHVRLSNAVYPSQKTLLTEWHPVSGLPLGASQPNAVALSFVDGSAGRYNHQDLIAPYPRGDGGGDAGFIPFGVYGMHTVEGWAGRDRQ